MLSITELVEMNHYIIKCSLNFVDKGVVHILELNHSNGINNKWEPEYCCLLYVIYLNVC
jgi:hypothetical protein